MLKRVVALYEAQGWQPVVAPEMEFFLVARNLDPAKKIEPMMGRSGRPAAARQAYSMTAVDEFGPVIDDIYDFAEAQGFEIDGITQEGGAGQLEINLRHGDPVKLADEVFFFKRLIREAALRHDCFATFMAKPIADEPGSAMHIHHSIIDRETGKNIFSRRQRRRHRCLLPLHRRAAEPPALGRRGAGALRQFLPALREGQRRADQPGMGPRQPHHRHPHPDLQPRSAADGKPDRRDGLQPLSRHRRLPRLRLSRADREARPLAQFRGDAYDGEEAIPRDLGAALDLFDEAMTMHDVLGPEFARVYSIVKRTEHNEFLQVISPWEREHLLLNV